MKKSIAIVGGGAAALALGCHLNKERYNITIYEKNKALGRKFLVAGDGGFNLTHSENLTLFKTRYTPQDFLSTALDHFNNMDLRHWLKELGIHTFVGSSKRIYPEKQIKPIHVLKALENELKKNEVTIKYNYEWEGWKDDALLFSNGSKTRSDYTVFCLGGGSWSVTGSNDKWLPRFGNRGINTIPFTPSNCAYLVSWKKDFIKNNEGKPLKNVSVTCENKKQKGELILTKDGLEGNAIYALGPQIRSLLLNGSALIYIDLKPMLSATEICTKLKRSKEKNTALKLKKELKLSTSQTQLLKSYTTKEEYQNNGILSRKIKELPIEITGTGVLDEAISTVGGISLEETSKHFELKKLPNCFCIGEMLNWDAPTGGYLLQSCFSSGVYLADYLNRKKGKCLESYP